MQSESKHLPNILVRHPRLTSVAWFSLAAYLAARFIVEHLLQGSEHWLELVAAGSAVLPAAMFGAKIVNAQRRPNVWRSLGWGALIVLISHILLSIFMMCTTSNIANMAAMMLMSLVFVGWITIPCGALAAVILRLLGPRAVKTPKGCALHGYTSPPPELT